LSERKPILPKCRKGVPRAARSLIEKRVANSLRIIRSGTYYGNNKGRLTRAVKCLLNQPHVETTADVVECLRKLHPPEKKSLPSLPAGAPKLIKVDEDLLLKIAKSMASGASPGPSGWTAELALPLLDDDTCRVGIAALVKAMANGDVSNESRDLLLASILTCFEKGNGTLRPIAMGEFFYKLTGNYLLSKYARNIALCFPAVQFAVNAAGGSEAAVHVIRAAMSKIKKSVLVSVDLPNAFNERERADVLAEIFAQEELKGMWRFAYFAYSSFSVLFVRGPDGGVAAWFLSRNGVRQGDPIAMLAFCVSMQPLYQVAADVAAVSVTAVADDLEMVGEVDEAFQAYDAFIAKAKKDGIKLAEGKASKSFVLWPHPCSPPQGLQDACSQRGLTLHAGSEVDGVWKGGCKKVLGVMMGFEDDEISEFVRERALSHSPFFEAVSHPDMEAQEALLLLGYCGKPRMNYISRCLPPRLACDGLGLFDNLVGQARNKITGVNLPLDSNCGATTLDIEASSFVRLPSRLSGFGFRSLVDVAPAAFLSAGVQALPTSHPFVEPFVMQTAGSSYVRDLELALGDLQDAGVNASSKLTTILNCPEKHPLHSTILAPKKKYNNLVEPAAIVPVDFCNFVSFYVTSDGPYVKPSSDWCHLQKKLTAIIESRRLLALWPSLSDQTKARVLSRCAPGACSWQHALPYHKFLRMHSEEVKRVFRMSLGLLQLDELPRTCVCAQKVCLGSIEGIHHAFSCRSACKAVTYPGHQLGVRLFDHLSSVFCGLDYDKSCSLDSGIIPDGEVILGDGTALDVDFTRTHPSCATAIKGGSALEQGSAAKAREEVKHTLYLFECMVQRRDFLALAVETYGCAGKEVADFIKKLARHASVERGMSSDQFTRFTKEALSVTVQRGNAILLRKFANITRAKALSKGAKVGVWSLEALPSSPASPACSPPASSSPFSPSPSPPPSPPSSPRRGSRKRGRSSGADASPAPPSDASSHSPASPSVDCCPVESVGSPAGAPVSSNSSSASPSSAPVLRRSPRKRKRLEAGDEVASGAPNDVVSSWKKQMCNFRAISQGSPADISALVSSRGLDVGVSAPDGDCCPDTLRLVFNRLPSSQRQQGLRLNSADAVRAAVTKHARSLNVDRRRDIFFETACSFGFNGLAGHDLQEWVYAWADVYERKKVYCEADFVRVFGDMVGVNCHVLYCPAADTSNLQMNTWNLCNGDAEAAPNTYMAWVNGNHFVPLYGNFDHQDSAGSGAAGEAPL
jgi:hypothetical protein